MGRSQCSVIAQKLAFSKHLPYRSENNGEFGKKTNKKKLVDHKKPPKSSTRTAEAVIIETYIWRLIIGGENFYIVAYTKWPKVIAQILKTHEPIFTVLIGIQEIFLWGFGILEFKCQFSSPSHHVW